MDSEVLDIIKKAYNLGMVTKITCYYVTKQLVLKELNLNMKIAPNLVVGCFYLLSYFLVNASHVL